MKALLRVGGIVLVTIAMSGPVNSVSQRQQLSRLEVLRSQQGDANPTLLEQAYLDAYGMLAPDTQCGRFFGVVSRRVLDDLVTRLRDKAFSDSGIALRMSGTIVRYIELNGGTEYRLFERAEINREGAFYRSSTAVPRRSVPDVGSFHPNTREARALILLHELAHLIKGHGGAWLVPDDGNDLQLSRLNNKTVECKCGEQIRTLSIF